MSAVAVLIVFAVLAFIGYLISKYVPMNPGPKKVFDWAFVIILILWLIKGLGILNWFGSINV